ncbi:MAG: RodZ domain-containing protein [Pseudomonadota bacterium]
MNQAMTQQEHNYAETGFHTDIPVGEILRRTRVHYNQSLMEVEANLRIRGSQLQAIEEGDFNAMPGRVYAIGFIRAYSEYLGLDGDRMVALFKGQYNAFKKAPSLNFPVTLAENKGPSPYIILGSLAGLIVFIAFWSTFMLPKHTRENIPPVTEELMQSSFLSGESRVDQTSAPSEGLLGSLSSNASNSEKIELVVSANSWTEIKDQNGTVILRKILKPGETYEVPQAEEGQNLILATGNAGGITIVIDGEKQGVLGTPAQVKKNIPLNSDSLKSLFEN